MHDGGGHSLGHGQDREECVRGHQSTGCNISDAGDCVDDHRSLIDGSGLQARLAKRRYGLVEGVRARFLRALFMTSCPYLGVVRDGPFISVLVAEAPKDCTGLGGAERLQPGTPMD